MSDGEKPQDKTCALPQILRPTAVERQQKASRIYSISGGRAPSSGDTPEFNKNPKLIMYHSANKQGKKNSVQLIKEVKPKILPIPCLMCYIISFYFMSDCT